MNAKQKAEILKEKGYFWSSTGSAPQEPVKYRTYYWSLRRDSLRTIARSRSFAEATHAAYQHYLDRQAKP